MEHIDALDTHGEVDPWEDGIPQSVLTRDDIIDLVRYCAEDAYGTEWFSFWVNIWGVG